MVSGCECGRGVRVRVRGELTWTIFVTESGIVTLVRLSQYLKACCESQRARVRRAEGSKRVRACGERVRVRVRGELTLPMLVTESGIVTLVRL